MSLKSKHLNPHFSSLFISICTNKGLGEQHYLGINKRDQELMEKENKARELMKSVIINESGPNNGLSKSFSEFFKMNVKIAVYEQSVDDLPSIFNNNNISDKKQTHQGKLVNEDQKLKTKRIYLLTICLLINKIKSCLIRWKFKQKKIRGSRLLTQFLIMTRNFKMNLLQLLMKTTIIQKRHRRYQLINYIAKNLRNLSFEKL